MELKGADFTRLLVRTYQRYKDGEISEQTAHKETYMINSIIKAIETTELEERLTKLEGILKHGK